MDTTQILLIITLGTTTVFSVIIGIQLIHVLYELRKTLSTINKITTGFEAVGLNLEHGFGEVVGFVNGFKTILKVFEIFAHKKNDKTK
ncbi:hypothetical protein A2334_04025 [Candidatus Roizmanbacteria bacterium RIFOXYB2_FULL_38_10]|uniref:Uncharacterized protein n=1 Tax=Candidatus Roizmanbacteria bacterium RIFOXYD1_FULL_38_12 TaxID=1802093 RepID=A0A1F7KZ94_9BACT|nr:MAG: hypothetical protein A3K47_00135 [Candidatus Roizmanbacteria bacterium RIFOXYA2_FULL_38_14]OGK63210.1 MAG: hypothetical protein A3K27_00135 [Candidatus Roizmanbacteria bacterium RIFOXYA1_FULL_37_12]OGK65056.1 MAG: hypothetical protein A3K38_00135 [Candidatus Roizmanbacteria bacterium RIFOXYB1_FULL_40_23]OGK68611.1 MAG: hypothetical protein A2334_04025 [Candidatus Roizmanbacteria bacterium RIFOXYB2_FULL_38_10]OGK69459.1 MAG: hypothetical protein A3K21_00135 [Candidatus Roizmanbacteria ba